MVSPMRQTDTEVVIGNALRILVAKLVPADLRSSCDSAHASPGASPAFIAPVEAAEDRRRSRAQ